MTEQEAYRIIRETYDDDDIDDLNLDVLFEAIYERSPEIDDREVGIWSLLCAATTGLCGCSTRVQHEAGGCRRNVCQPAAED